MSLICDIGISKGYWYWNATDSDPGKVWAPKKVKQLFPGLPLVAFQKDIDVEMPLTKNLDKVWALNENEDRKYTDANILNIWPHIPVLFPPCLWRMRTIDSCDLSLPFLWTIKRWQSWKTSLNIRNQLSVVHYFIVKYKVSI